MYANCASVLDMRDELKKSLFERLVANGFDFLNHGVANLEDHPKQALTAFSTGLELILKAGTFKASLQHRPISHEKEAACRE